MARSGRKRKIGERHPGGQLKRRKERPREKEPNDDRVRLARQPHRRGIARLLKSRDAAADTNKIAAGEEAESPIGRMWLAGLLLRDGDPDQSLARDRYEAANMFANIVGNYRQVIGAPNSGGGGGRGQACGADFVCVIDPSQCECQRRQERYDKAFETLALLGRDKLMAVNAVVINRQAIGLEEVVNLVDGLEALRELFGLTPKAKRKQYRNAQ